MSIERPKTYYVYTYEFHDDHALAGVVFYVGKGVRRTNRLP